LVNADCFQFRGSDTLLRTPDQLDQRTYNTREVLQANKLNIRAMIELQLPQLAPLLANPLNQLIILLEHDTWQPQALHLTAQHPLLL
jgi:hypothetical protein